MAASIDPRDLFSEPPCFQKLFEVRRAEAVYLFHCFHYFRPNSVLAVSSVRMVGDGSGLGLVRN